MREIEFRGMGTDGKWYYGLLSISQGYSSQPKPGYYISNKAGSPWAYQVRPETVGQYTGLKDKNGVKIYEGDVLKIYNSLNDFESSTILGMVRLGEGTFDMGAYKFTGFYIEYVNDGTQGEETDQLIKEECKRYEVINNIY